MSDKVVSKVLALTDTTDGHKFVGNDFGFSGARYQYLRLSDLNTGTVQIKFGLTDDWATLTLPFILAYPRFEEFYLKPSVANNLVAIVSLYGN